MSPEQARGEGHRVDGRSDVFSLGVVFYELLTAQRPFRGDSVSEILHRIAAADAKPLRQVDDAIPKELERICLKALSLRASDRYLTAKDFADDLRAFRQQSPEAAASSEKTPAQLTLSDKSNAPAAPAKIIPKGLRSFGKEDADFFLELLPGPFDRDGLPESIRFWKSKIEQTDPDETFTVGLVYGPSGCGKSSLVKAGLIPRLRDDVLVVYVEATPDQTEARLQAALRKCCPALSTGLGLQETLASLRRAEGLPRGKKVLLVFDQFEQWLHANKGERNTELARALRQCDGVRLQCVLMVRDDFWLAATRLMTELEVEMLQGHNTALADLFDLDHARKVLAAFGAAYGKLPENLAELSAEQADFLQQAVTGLAEEGKVVCVRLAMFAEMMKSKPWTPASLQEVGGTQGVGVTFLEETFSARTAHPTHRLHQKAARAVLNALLPESGSNIKGEMKSSEALLAASGYANSPEDFASLIKILDAETRLITPTDPEGFDSEEAPDTGEAGQKYYQLTHDYLIPSLREWLTRKQKETRRGQAELRLAERAALYSTKQESRHLPSTWEFVNIRCFTRRQDWTVPQRRMMHKASRFHLLRWGTALAILLAISVIVQQFVAAQRQYVAEQRLENDRRRTATLVDAVLTVPAQAVPLAMANLQPLKEHALPELRKRLEDPDTDPVGRLHAALALADFGEVPSDVLVESVAIASDAECPNLVASLTPVKDQVDDTLLEKARTAEDAKAKMRLAATLMYLDDPRAAEELLALGPNPMDRTYWILHFGEWLAELTAVANMLHETEGSAFRSNVLRAGQNFRRPNHLDRTPVIERSDAQLLSVCGGRRHAQFGGLGAAAMGS